MEKELIVSNTDGLKELSLGCGCNGECFLTKDGKVYKEFFFSDGTNDINIKLLCGLKSRVFVFPETLVYGSKNGNMLGYIMNYVSGKLLTDIDSDTLLRDYLYALLRVERETIELSKNHIKINDSSYYNIIYTNDNSLEIIDTDFYDVDSKEQYLYRKNMISISYGTLYPFIGYNKSIDFINERLNQLYFYLNGGLIRPSEFISEFMDEFESMGIQTNTIEEFNDSLKLVRKEK